MRSQQPSQCLRHPLPTPPRTCVTPIAANTYGVQFMMDKDAHDDLEYLRAVLGHEAPTVAQVIARGLKALRREVDRRKFAATDTGEAALCTSRAPRTHHRHAHHLGGCSHDHVQPSPHSKAHPPRGQHA